MWPDISIIFPVYNVSKYVRQSLLSILEQTYEGDVELIVVEDKSTDDSLNIVQEILDSYTGKFKTTILVHEANKGLSAARNTGMRNAHGEYILFIDSDDMMLPGSLETLAGPDMESRPDLIISTYLTSNGKIFNPKIDPGAYHEEQIFTSYLSSCWSLAAWNKLYRTDFLQEIGAEFPEGYIFEDVPWSFQIAHRAKSMVVVDRPTYSYTIREGSLSHCGKPGKDISNITLILILLESYIRDNGLKESIAVQDYLYRFKNDWYNVFNNIDRIEYGLWRNFFLAMRPDIHALRTAGKLSRSAFVRELYNYFPPRLAFAYWQIMRQIQLLRVRIR